MKNKISKIFLTGLTCASPLALINTTSCSSSDKIQWANFESYMDDDLMDHLEEEYNVQFQWYTVTEMIETKFEKFYDLAVPSGYELVALWEKNMLQKIDWSKFNVHYTDPESGESKLVTNSTDAMYLYHDNGESIQRMNDAFTTILRSEGTIKESESFNVLDYGVPYFEQKFTFCYKGDEIKFYNHETGLETSTPTWSDIFYTISPANPHLDSRFNPSSGHRIAMLDDAKSLYDVSRIMQCIDDNEAVITNIIPEGDQIPQMTNTFSHMTDYFKNKSDSWFALNTDSGLISRNLADSKGNSAAFAWSGDAIYAARGAEEFDHLNGDNFHVVTPYGASLDEIEYVVINNKNAKNTEKLDRIYKAVYDVCLDGAECDEESILDLEDPDDEDSRYKHWAMQNWDCTNYVPMLKSIYDAVSNPDCEYWDDVIDDDYSLELEAKTRQMFSSIVKATDQDIADPIFGKTLTALQNSNTHWAWLETRGKL